MQKNAGFFYFLERMTPVRETDINTIGCILFFVACKADAFRKINYAPPCGRKRGTNEKKTDRSQKPGEKLET